MPFNFIKYLQENFFHRCKEKEREIERTKENNQIKQLVFSVAAEKRERERERDVDDRKSFSTGAGFIDMAMLEF